MHFSDRSKERAAQDFKEEALRLLHSCEITYQELEAHTGIDWQIWRRAFDLTTEFYPLIILPRLLKGEGLKWEQFGEALAKLVMEDYLPIDRSKLNGRLDNEERDITIFVADLMKQTRDGTVNKTKCRQDLNAIIECAQQGLAELGQMR